MSMCVWVVLFMWMTSIHAPHLCPQSRVTVRSCRTNERAAALKFVLLLINCVTLNK